MPRREVSMSSMGVSNNSFAFSSLDSWVETALLQTVAGECLASGCNGGRNSGTHMASRGCLSMANYLFSPLSNSKSSE